MGWEPLETYTCSMGDESKVTTFILAGLYSLPLVAFIKKTVKTILDGHT